MKAYKLLSVRRDDTIGPLFINRPLRIRLGTWMTAENHPTKGYCVRPGWHCTAKPVAPHLSLKGRRWYEVEIKDYVSILRPASQGGLWYLAERMRVVKEI